MSIDELTFKRAMSHFATGVTIVTTSHEGEPTGITANAFSSVSLSPFLVLTCVDKSLYTHERILQSGHFAVNILSVQQLAWAERFAGLYPELSNRFEGIPFDTAVTGSPILPGTLAWVDCELWKQYDGGDHTIFVGQVVAGKVAEAGQPLLYFGGRWGQLAATGPVAGSTWPDEEEG